MEQDKLELASIDFLWNFYERATNNYSMIMRMLHCVEDGDGLIRDMPRVFVESSVFDMCKIVVYGSGTVSEGFFTIEQGLSDVEHEIIRSFSAGAMSPFVTGEVFGCGLVYIYPLKENESLLGFLLLGRRLPVELDQRTLRELGIVCDIYNQSLLLHTDFCRHREMAETKTIFQTFIDDFPDALFMVDRNGSIVFANERAKKEFDNEKCLLVGEKIDNIVAGLGSDFYRKDGILHGEVKFKCRGKYKIFKMDCFPVKEAFDKGAWKGIVLKDVIERRIKEEELLTKEKMESVGMLAGGIAHDFNNLLTGILGYASLIKNFLSADEKLYRYASAIETSAQRAAKLSQHLLNFSRRQRKAQGFVDLNILMEDILFLVKESFRDIEIETSLDPNLYSIKGDEGQLQNVFLNLLANARDAMGGKGTLKVHTERKHYVGDREFVLVEIADSGPGIDEELRERIFEPYFTTKENGTNLGIGLYLVDKTVREHGGLVEVESPGGSGTKFSIYLPLPAKTVEPGRTQEGGVSKTLQKKHRILIVDDEEVVRNLIRGVLIDEPTEILEAADGPQALEIFMDQHAGIDLVILDMIMPGMKGDEVLAEMRKIRQDIKVIASSGYMSEEQRKRLKENNVDGFLDKPFRDKDVMRIMIEVLSKK